MQYFLFSYLHGLVLVGYIYDNMKNNNSACYTSVILANPPKDMFTNPVYN